MSEETIRYWGQTEADREAALAADSSGRTAAGWRVASRRTEFAFGKPGMDLIVTWVNDGAEIPAGGMAAGTTPGHFDLNAAIAAATREMPDKAARISPAPTAAPTFELEPAVPPGPAARPAAEPAPEPPATAGPSAESAPESWPASLPEPKATPERRPEPEPEFESPADRFESEVEAPSFTEPEATETFGPNAEDVLWLLDGLAGLDRETAAEIASAYGQTDEEGRDRALRSMTDSFSKPPYSGWMKAAEDLVDSWVESVGAAGNDEVLYDTVASAAIDAVDALIVQDELDSDSFTALYHPWGSVMDPADEDALPDDAPEDTDETAEEVDAATDGHAAGAVDADFGPNADLLTEFFRALQGVIPAQIDELVKTGTAEWESSLNIARGRLDDAAGEKPEYGRQRDAVAREVAAWADGRRGIQFDYSGGETSTLDRQAAQPAVVDAAEALLMADLLEADDAKDLYSAWEYAVGLPALPDFEGDDSGADGSDVADEPDGGARDSSDLGPNADDLAAFFEALSSLTPEQLTKLGAAGNGPNATRLDESWGRAVEIAAEKPEYRAQFETVVREVMAWRDGATGRLCGYQHAQGAKAERERARSRILRCAVGLLYADLLDREDAERLYGPWAAVVGKPPLPEYTTDRGGGR